MKGKHWLKKRKLMIAVSSVGAIGLTAGAVAAVVSCGTDYGKYFRPWGDVELITDSGSVADKSFNQGAWEGVVRWSLSENNVDGQTIGFTQPAQATSSLLQKAYETAIYNNAKYLVLPGFNHGAYAPGEINKFLNRYPNTRAIAIDTSADFKQPSKDRVVHARFYTQESGFLAAIGIGLFANSPKSNNGFKVNGDKIKVATFGGQPYNSVTSFMDGLLQGMNIFNKYLKNEITDIPFNQSDFPELDGAQPKGFELYFNKQAVTANGLKPHFTESFESGVAGPVALDYLNNGVQFIFPVAGPQTGDVVTAIKSKGAQGQAFVIGVDTEQSVLYGKPYTVLGSAMKGLAKTTYDILSLNPANKSERNFDTYIKKQATSQFNATWFGLNSGEPSFDPAEMYTGFAFNPDFRGTFGPNSFMNRFNAYAKQRTADNPKGSIFICTDGFGRETQDYKADTDGDGYIIANCNLTDDFKNLLYADLNK